MFVLTVQTIRKCKAPGNTLRCVPSRYYHHYHTSISHITALACKINQSYFPTLYRRYPVRLNNANYAAERLLCSGKSSEKQPPHTSGTPVPPSKVLPQNQSPQQNKTQLANQTPSAPSTQPKIVATPLTRNDELRNEKANKVASQLTKTLKSDSQLAKLSELPIKLNKKVGWFVSGTAVAILTALYGKLYMFFGALPLFFYHSKDLDVMSKTFNRDTTFLWRYSKSWFLAKRIKNENLTLPKIFQQTEKRHPDKIMLQMHDQSWKYKDIGSYANRTSRLMQKYGFQKGDVVAIMALNSPEMVAIMLGMANIGIITTLISTELRNEGLTNAIRNSGCKGIIFDDALIHAFGDVYQNFPGTKIFQMRHKAIQPEFHVLEEELLKEFNDLPEVFINVHYDDPLMYMYSPDDIVFREPIVITHEKFLFDSMVTAMMLDLKPREQIYSPSPMHETSGMVLGIGPSITNGVTTILRPKFSATEYFRECYVHHCTVGQYSGSMCKQLLLSPVSPIETFHPVRAMYGTGLESDYWQEFVDRFGTKMYEVHDTSQENTNLMNMEGKVGVVGFRPKLIPSFLFPHYVIKVFGKDNIPVRGPNGLCQMCESGEPGMLIKLWTSSGQLPTKVKTIQNIFKQGDMAITTGEILTLDEQLYLRPQRKHMDKSWLKKLVTSEEVEYIATKLTSKRCAAYSIETVEKQNFEILAIEDPQKTIDMQKFTDDLVDHLPINWMPHYVRFVPTFTIKPNKKIDKQCLIKQGLNMEGDLVYYFNKSSLSYQPFMWAKGSNQKILNGEEITPILDSTPIKTTTFASTPKPSQTATKSDTTRVLQLEIIVQKHDVLKEPIKKAKETTLNSKIVDKASNMSKEQMPPLQAQPSKPNLVESFTKPSLKTDETKKQMAATPIEAFKKTDILKPRVNTDIKKEAEKTSSSTPASPPTSTKTIPTTSTEKKTDKVASTPLPKIVFTSIPPKPKTKPAEKVTSTSGHETASVVKEKKSVDIFTKQVETPAKHALPTNTPDIKPAKKPEVVVKKDDAEKVDFADMISRKLRTFAEPVMNKLMKERLNAQDKIPTEKPKIHLAAVIVPPAPNRNEKLHKLDMSAVENKTRALNVNQEAKGPKPESKEDLKVVGKVVASVKPDDKTGVKSETIESKPDTKVEIKAENKAATDEKVEKKGYDTNLGFGATQGGQQNKEDPSKKS